MFGCDLWKLLATDCQNDRPGSVFALCHHVRVTGPDVDPFELWLPPPHALMAVMSARAPTSRPVVRRSLVIDREPPNSFPFRWPAPTIPPTPRGCQSLSITLSR